MRFLVTAGNTRERIDDVRDWGNIFTGATGLGIARALSRVGEVDLFTSNAAHREELARAQGDDAKIRVTPFLTHADLRRELERRVPTTAYEAVFMTAAVADYRPAGAFSVESVKTNPDGTQTWVVRNAQRAKVRSTHGRIAFVGERTEKIVDLFRTRWGYRGLLVKFKLEVGLPPEVLLRVAEKSRRASDADYLVANTLEMVAGEQAGAYLLWEGGNEWVPRAQLPERLLNVAVAGKVTGA